MAALPPLSSVVARDLPYNPNGDTVCLDDIVLPPIPRNLEVPLIESAFRGSRMVQLANIVFDAAPVLVRGMYLGSKNEIQYLQVGIEGQPGTPHYVVSRLATFNMQENGYYVQSQVDTMRYLLHNPAINVSVPRIFAYAIHPRPPDVGFQIWEHVRGDRLAERFSTFNTAQKRATIQQYARIIHELSKCRFSSIGSLEQANDGSYQVVGLSSFRPNALQRVSLTTAAAMYQPFSSAHDWLITTERENKLLLEAFPHLVAAENDSESQTRAKLGRYLWTFDDMLTIIRWSAINLDAEQLELSSIYCLCPTDTSDRNIMIRTAAREVGFHLTLIDWDDAGIFPIWRLVQPPDWLSQLSDGTPLPAEEAKRHHKTFRDAIRSLDGRGQLYRAMDPKFDFLRRMASVATSPWYMASQREAFIQQFVEMRSPPPPTRRTRAANRSGYATDVTPRRRRS